MRRLTKDEKQFLSPSSLARLEEVAPEVLKETMVERICRKIRNRLRYVNTKFGVSIFKLRGRRTGRLAWRVGVGKVWVRYMEGRGIDIGIGWRGR